MPVKRKADWGLGLFLDIYNDMIGGLGKDSILRGLLEAADNRLKPFQSGANLLISEGEMRFQVFTTWDGRQRAVHSSEQLETGDAEEGEILGCFLLCFRGGL